MRSSWLAVAAAFGLAAAPQVTQAEDVQDQLARMQERMQAMEDRLQATQDALEQQTERAEQQQQVIEEAGLADPGSGLSGLSEFLDTVEVGGLVAGSFVYNENDPEEASQANTIGLRSFDADSQSFNFDQLILNLAKPSTAESRGGFRAEVLYGKTASLLTGTTRPIEDDFTDFDAGDFPGEVANFRDDDDFVVTEAYVTYLFPEMAPGLDIEAKAGKFYTLVGSEVVPTNQNYNISRGLLFTLLQPIDHTGATLTFSGDPGFAGAEGETLALEIGGVNGFGTFTNGPDVNDEKTAIASLSYGTDMWSVALGGLYGAEAPSDSESKLALVDITASASPTDMLDVWVNLDWTRAEIRGNAFDNDPDAWGASAGFHVELTRRLGAAVRGEYVRDDEGFLQQVFGAPFPSVGLMEIDNEIWGVTGTLDFALTQHLTVRGEVRHDEVDATMEDIFSDEDSGGSNPFLDSDQTSAAVEAIYTF